MSDPFAVALAALFSAPGSLEAQYQSVATGVSIPIRVIRSQASREKAVGGGRYITDTNIIEIQRSDVAQPHKGDLLTIGVETLKINAGAELDIEGLTWLCSFEPV